MQKNTRPCKICGEPFETPVGRPSDKILLCKKCRKTIDSRTHCEYCGDPWSRTAVFTSKKDGKQFGEMFCDTCGYSIIPDLLSDIFSLPGKQ
jgi:transcription elongation factor Elf1